MKKYVVYAMIRTSFSVEVEVESDTDDLSFATAAALLLTKDYVDWKAGHSEPEFTAEDEVYAVDEVV